MSSEKTDILVYIPFKKEDLDEKEINWIDSFQTILGISLHQITKQNINITSSYLIDSSAAKKGFIENSKVIIELLSKDFDPANKLKLKDQKHIQIACHPDVKLESSNEFIINLFDEIANKPVDLSEHIAELKNEIWLKFLDVAYEVKRRILTNVKTEGKLKGKIFVAETSSDQSYNRETIIRELEHLGFEVLPDGGFPKDMIAFSEMVHSNLSQAFLSIHIIGNFYAPLLNNIEISSIELQNDLFHEVAAESRVQNKVIKRLVWIPPNIKPKSEKQKLYIESFKRNIELLEYTEIIQTPIEVFKTIIKKNANEILDIKTKSKSKPIDEKSKSVYLVSNNSSKKEYNSIKQSLLKSKVKILETTNKASKIELIQEHYYNLVNCDSLLIDYSIENNQWLNSKLSDILKSPGFGRKKDFSAKSVIINTERNPDINIQIENLDIIKKEEKDISKRLNSFIEKINRNDS